MSALAIWHRLGLERPKGLGLWARAIPGLKVEAWGTHFRAGFTSSDMGHPPFHVVPIY